MTRLMFLHGLLDGGFRCREDVNGREDDGLRILLDGFVLMLVSGFWRED